MRKLTKLSTFVFSAIVVLVAIVLLSLSLISLSAQSGNRHVAVDYLRTMDRLDHELREVVLEAHTFRIDNYDPVVVITTQLETLCPGLTNSGEAFLVSHNPGIEVQLKQYCLKSRITLDAVEHFKSKNSVLKNSIKYFPVLVGGLQTEATRYRALRLYNDILLHCIQPTWATIKTVSSDLAQLRASMQSSAKDRPTLLQVLRHADMILQSAAERTKYEDTIYDPALPAAISEISNQYLSATDHLEQQSTAFKTGSISFSVVLILALLVLLYRLQQGGVALHDLNINLESKVHRRTQELQWALSDLASQQQVLAHATKMSALGEMAGGIAHEINTPLAAISLKAETLLLEDVSESAEKTLNEIVSIVERIAKIVLGLRRFAREDRTETFKKVTYRSIIDDTLILCSQKFKSHEVELQIELADEIAIDCIPEQISQVLLNLLNNSFDAISNQPEKKWVKVSASIRDGSSVLAVTDSGTGIPESVQAKLMQPFFTTKESGKGTGIGLSISRGIVEKHGGRLEYDRSNPNTTFLILIPLAVSRQAA